jgi:hypothetical protein
VRKTDEEGEGDRGRKWRQNERMRGREGERKRRREGRDL